MTGRRLILSFFIEYLFIVSYNISDKFLRGKMMANPIGHFKTITKHRHTVIKHCAKAGILGRGLLHDLSKYMPAEFIGGAKYYTGTRSPNDLQRQENGYSAAWMHHKGRNKHHFEYWTDYDPVKKVMSPVPMPLKYVIEMFCDRVAACKIYQKDAYRQDAALRYYENAKSHYVMHPNTAALLEKLLEMLAQQGEDAVFHYIRSELLGK